MLDSLSCTHRVLQGSTRDCRCPLWTSTCRNAAMVCIFEEFKIRVMVFSFYTLSQWKIDNEVPEVWYAHYIPASFRILKTIFFSTCSGAIYIGVPIAVLVISISLPFRSSRSAIRPRSQILTRPFASNSAFDGWDNRHFFQQSIPIDSLESDCYRIAKVRDRRRWII